MENQASNEIFKRQTKTEQIEIRDKNIINNFQKKNRKALILTIIIPISIFLIAGIGVLMIFLFLSKKKKENKKNEDNNIENIDDVQNIEDVENIEEKDTIKEFLSKIDSKNNSITGVYSLEKGKEAIIFNPKKIDLDEKNYFIEIIQNDVDKSNNSTYIRNLREYGYKIVPENSGIFEIRISFNIILTSMFELFKNCNNLIEVDLSHLDSSQLVDLNSTFENCENLENANLTIKNSTNIQSMSNSFSGCRNLKDVDLSNFTPKHNISLDFMFKDCIKLSYVDLSNFFSFNFKGIFSGCFNLKIFDSNKNLIENKTNDGNESKSNISINDLIDSFMDKLDLKCEIGKNEKCKTCEKGLINSQYCEKCNDEYYIPLKSKRKSCLKCDEDCLQCIGSVTVTYCLLCKEGYFSNSGKCMKKCEIGNETKCNSCDPNSENLCKSCNKGYFLPENNKTECKKCAIKNCIECEDNSDFARCSLCEEGYILSGNKCLKICEISESTQCNKCNEEEGKIDECIECNKGYYLSEFNHSYCLKCSIENCDICLNDKCTKCEDNFIPEFINGEINSCYKEIPERIDIVTNGQINEGVIEIKEDYVVKTQLSNGIKYNIQNTCSCPYSSGWWKDMVGNCHFNIYFNISALLPNNQHYLQDDYILYLIGSEMFGATGASYREYMASTFFFQSWGPEWGHNSISNFGSPTFGIYKNLERDNHDNFKACGGIYNRGKENGYEFLKLEGFNYTTTVKNGTGNIGWRFNIGVGQYSAATVRMYITFIIDNLFLIRKKN